MIRTLIDNEILYSILEIEKNKNSLNNITVSNNLSTKFRKNTKKRSAYASNKIEGNPLTFEQAEAVIDATSRHFLKPEQEIRNYYLAIECLENKLVNKEPVSKKLILEIQKQICDGEPKEKIGFRGSMPPGVLFAVWNDDGTPAYIPPEYSEVPKLIDELIEYVNTSDDHPLVKAAVIHYQLVTIHPFEDGNGRTARIISSYFLSLTGFGFKNIGSLEEYMSYNIDEYYDSLQMNLPVDYYSGRNNPPRPDIWIKYYLRIFNLYASKVLSIAKGEVLNEKDTMLSHLSKKAQAFLEYLNTKNINAFTPIDLANELNVTNRTIINWCLELSNNGFLKPILVNKRIRKYEVID